MKDVFVKSRLFVVAGVAVGVVVAGCASGNGLPSTDKDLRRSSRTLAKEAGERSYPADAERGENAPIVGEIDYQLDVINLINLGDADWIDVVVWVNGQYSAPMASLPAHQQRGANFGRLYDSKGAKAPSKGTWVQVVEIFYGGKLYTIRTRAAD